MESGYHAPLVGRLGRTSRPEEAQGGRLTPEDTLTKCAFLLLMFCEFSLRAGARILSGKMDSSALAGVAQLAGASSRRPKGCGFDFLSGHIPRLWVRSPVGVRTGGCTQLGCNLSMFLPMAFLPLPLPSSLSLKKINNEKMTLGED